MIDVIALDADDTLWENEIHYINAKAEFVRLVSAYHPRVEWIEQYGTPEKNPAFWSSISANSFLTDLSGPLQLHHGTADGEVPLEFSVKLASDIWAAGGVADLYTYSENDHNIAQSFDLAMDRTIEFFDRYLK